jgi:hypothetical protein
MTSLKLSRSGSNTTMQSDINNTRQRGALGCHIGRHSAAAQGRAYFKHNMHRPVHCSHVHLQRKATSLQARHAFARWLARLPPHARPLPPA